MRSHHEPPRSSGAFHPQAGLASGLADGETASGREIPEPAIHKARVVPYSATDVRLMSRRIVSRVSRSQEWRASGHSHATRDRPDPRHGKYIKIKLMPVEPSRKVISPILVLAKKRSAQVGRKYRTDVSNQRGASTSKACRSLSMLRSSWVWPRAAACSRA